MDTEAFITAYITAAVQLCEESAKEDDDYDPSAWVNDNIRPNSYIKMKIDCQHFIDEAGDLLDGWDSAQAGTDFWLTRNGHGAGFWDREVGTEDSRKKLSDMARELGERCVYMGDDGFLHYS